jgi:hypothetical protein
MPFMQISGALVIITITEPDDPWTQGIRANLDRTTSQKPALARGPWEGGGEPEAGKFRTENQFSFNCPFFPNVAFEHDTF